MQQLDARRHAEGFADDMAGRARAVGAKALGLLLAHGHEFRECLGRMLLVHQQHDGRGADLRDGLDALDAVIGHFHQVRHDRDRRAQDQSEGRGGGRRAYHFAQRERA
ncbi:hypothetical protein D3C79_986700 [compost metagenome]